MVNDIGGTKHGKASRNFNSNRLKRLAEFQFASCLVLLALLVAGCGDDEDTQAIPIPVGSILLDRSTLELEVGEEEKLHAVVAPFSAANKDIRWRSDDERVASVDPSGLVRAVSQWKTVIFAVSADGTKTAACSVTVRLPVGGMSLERCPGTMAVGNQEQWRALVEPRDAGNQAVTWTSSDSSVATVDENGLVRALAPGEVTIVVRSKEDKEKTKSCRMTVVIPVKDVSFKECLTEALSPDQKRTLHAIVEPDNATWQGVTWSTDNPSVAMVDSNGVVTAGNTGGTAAIRATTDDGDKKAICAVNVHVPVTGITINGCSLAALPPNQTRQLAAGVAPSGANNKGVTWSTDNPSVAMVDSNGVVTSHSTSGTATITATTHEGGKTAHCLVNGGSSQPSWPK